MTDRILDISDAPARLSARNANLVVERKDQPEVAIPFADLAVVIVSYPQVSYTHAVLAGLAAAKGIFIACNEKHLPAAMLLPLDGHFTQVERFERQARASLPTQKRLWQQIVRAKIRAQARLLEKLYLAGALSQSPAAVLNCVPLAAPLAASASEPGTSASASGRSLTVAALNGAGGLEAQALAAKQPAASGTQSTCENALTLTITPSPVQGILALQDRVRSGDSENAEAQAARRYWPALFGEKFRREPDAEDQNRLLNYGYAILRAVTARAICAAGLHPSLGLHHCNRYDTFCLADDLMEPYRPLVDAAVVAFVSKHGPQAPLDQAAKCALITPLLSRYEWRGEARSLFDWFQRLASSLADVYLGEAGKIDLPEF